MAWKLPARPVYFNLTVMVKGPFAGGVGSVRVNYTVAIYPVRCMYWGMEEGKWLEEGCKVRKTFFHLVFTTSFHTSSISLVDSLFFQQRYSHT